MKTIIKDGLIRNRLSMFDSNVFQLNNGGYQCI